MNFLSKYFLTILGVVAGAIGGYLYYFFIGCSNGSCMITSHPINSSLYGSVMGGLLFNIFKKEKINNNEKL